MPDLSPEEQLRMHDPRVIDSRGSLVDLTGMSETDLQGAIRVMNAMHRWRVAEQRVTEASRAFMKLSETDMRAVRYILVQSDGGEIVSARDVGEYLGVSSASMTTLLDRLEEGGHLRRRPHPHDRRALALEITESTRAAAETTIGAEHARRFNVAAGLSEPERRTILKFLDLLSDTSEKTWKAPGGPSA